MRREIANSNERRRMQSINAGFQNLKALLPQAAPVGGSGGYDKLSKATILQQAANYIRQLDDERRRGMRNGDQQRVAALSVKCTSSPQPALADIPPASPLPMKRRKRDTECSDEGIVMAYPAAAAAEDAAADELRREVLELRSQLEVERQQRHLLEQSCLLLQERLQSAPVTTPSMPSAPSRVVAHDGYSYAEPAPTPADQSWPPSTSMSRRNLQMIVEAIHHLEGGVSCPLDRDSGASTLSEASLSDDAKSSDGSGRDSPLSCSSTATMVVHADSISRLASGARQGLFYRPTFLSQMDVAQRSAVASSPYASARR